jgi:hypothetical protein
MSVRASDETDHKQSHAGYTFYPNFQYIYTATDLREEWLSSYNCVRKSEEVAPLPNLQAGEGSMIIQKSECTLS